MQEKVRALTDLPALVVETRQESEGGGGGLKWAEVSCQKGGEGEEEKQNGGTKEN